MDDFLTEALKIILVPAVAAISTALTALIVQLLRKANIELSAENRAKLETITQQGILLMEEKAAAALRAGVGQVAAREKLEGAMEYLLDKVPGVTREEAQNLVLSELPKLGLGASDFARAVLVQATGPVAVVPAPPSLPQGEK